MEVRQLLHGQFISAIMALTALEKQSQYKAYLQK